MFIYIQDLLLQTLHFKISLCHLSHYLSLLLYKAVSFYILKIVNCLDKFLAFICQCKR